MYCWTPLANEVAALRCLFNRYNQPFKTEFGFRIYRGEMRFNPRTRITQANTSRLTFEDLSPTLQKPLEERTGQTRDHGS